MGTFGWADDAEREGLALCGLASKLGYAAYGADQGREIVWRAVSTPGDMLIG